jgi:hypothetical protein
VVELADAFGLLVEETRAQHVGEEVVVPVPVPAIVERYDEEVRPVELLEHRLAARRAGDGIAQGTGEPVEDTGVQEEVANVVGLAVEHLLHEVVDDEPIVAGEARDEPTDVVAALHRQRRELQRRDPSLGTGFERVDVGRAQRQTHRLVEVARGFVRGEAQVGGANLAELAAGAQARQGQRRVGAAREHEVHVRCAVFEQERDRLVDLGRLDHVVVVEHEHHAGLARLDVVQQRRQRGVDRGRRRP